MKLKINKIAKGPTAQNRIWNGCARSIGPTSSEILYQLRDIYYTCRIYWNGTTYKCKTHNGKIEIISFGLNISLSTSPHCNFIGSFGVLLTLWYLQPFTYCDYIVVNMLLEFELFLCTIDSTGNSNPSGAPDITSGFVWSLYCCCF